MINNGGRGGGGSCRPRLCFCPFRSSRVWLLQRHEDDARTATAAPPPPMPTTASYDDGEYSDRYNDNNDEYNDNVGDDGNDDNNDVFPDNDLYPQPCCARPPA